jgi:predicted transcriptional regulator
MKTARQELMEVLDRLPDDTPMESLLAEFHYRASVLRGLEDARRGDVVDSSEVRSRLNRWLESSGREKLSEPSNR